MPIEPDAVEVRVLGCLIEKQRTTPDAYPLSLNALRLACNQATNRDPVVAYDDSDIRPALERLSRRGWVRLASGRGSRAVKYRHLLGEALGLDGAEMAVLCLLMLRGAQTPGELKARSERLHPFADLADLRATLDRLAESGRIERLPRRPGQKEERYRQLLGGGEDAPPAASVPFEAPAGADPAPPAGPAGASAAAGALETRLERLELEAAELRAALAALRAELGER